MLGQPSFRNGVYRGYEVRLEIKRWKRHEPVALQTAREIYDFMREISRESSEMMYELLFDTKRWLQGVYLVGKGGIDTCHVDPQDVYKAALVTNSPAFALVHNHPSGVAEPSAADVALTRRVAEGSQILGLTFIDSIIVGDGRYFSFYKSGLLQGSGGQALDLSYRCSDEARRVAVASVLASSTTAHHRYAPLARRHDIGDPRRHPVAELPAIRRTSGRCHCWQNPACGAATLAPLPDDSRASSGPGSAAGDAWCASVLTSSNQERTTRI